MIVAPDVQVSVQAAKVTQTLHAELDLSETNGSLVVAIPTEVTRVSMLWCSMWILA
jgi:hypothetical protein